MIDLYCERLAPGLLGEPLNALSNLAFFVAGAFALRLGRNARDGAAVVLAVLILLIGAGSSAFHLTATAWAQRADVIPIAGFQLAFLATWLARQQRCSIIITTAAVALYAAAMVATGAVAPGLLNGSVAYLPALLVLALIAFRARRDANAKLLTVATLGFALSLSARTLDIYLCPHWPYGTHWAWHLLNGGVLYLLVAAVVRVPRQA